jgi:PiT family inorganic phosphate transporter
MTALELFIFLVLLAITFGVGSQDETIAPIKENDVLGFKKTLLFGSIFAFLGVLFFSQKVGATIGVNMLGPEVNYSEGMMLAVLLSIAVWILIATWTNVPISITHSVVGALIGLALAWSLVAGKPFVASMNWVKVGEVIAGLLISPLIGFCLAYATQFAINRIMKHVTASKGLTRIERAENVLRPWVIVFAALNALSRAGNDSGKVIGVAFSMLTTGPSAGTQGLAELLIIAFIYAAGLYFVGRRLVISVGSSTGGSLRPSEALSIEITVSVILFVATMLGLPISGTQVLVFALIGSARVRGEKPDPKTYHSIVLSWVLTIPVAAGLAAAFFLLVNAL